MADTSYLVGAGELQDPCNGLFTFRVATANFQQDVFVSFMDRAMLFSSFKANLPWGSGNTYDYLYGVGAQIDLDTSLVVCCGRARLESCRV